MGKFLITFLLFVLIIVFIKASKSKPNSGETNKNKSTSSKSRSFSDGKGKKNESASSKSRSFSDGIGKKNESASSESRSFSKKKGKGNGRCNDHEQCPDGYACLLAEGKKVKKCLQCNCSETSQCYLERETTFCNCSGTGFTGQYCETLLPPCPMGWYQNRNSCYIYDNTAYDWLSAVSHCQSLSPSGYPNSHIVEITDEEESQVAFAISSVSGDSDAWIGLSDMETEGIFKWINSGNSLTYQPEGYKIFDAYYYYWYYYVYYNYNWYFFYYNNYDYVKVMDCVHLHYSHWDAERCSKYKPVVCEMPALIQ